MAFVYIYVSLILFTSVSKAERFSSDQNESGECLSAAVAIHTKAYKYHPKIQKSEIQNSENSKSKIRKFKLRFQRLEYAVSCGRVMRSVTKMASNGGESESNKGELDNEVCM